MKVTGTILSLAFSIPACFAQVFRPLNTVPQYSNINTQPIDLTAILNNRAWGRSPGDADFDGGQNGYPAQYHPGSNLSYDGFQYALPAYKAAGYDNVIAQAQNIPVKQDRYFSVQMLAASETSSAEGYVTGNYADNSSSSGEILVPPWWLWNYPSGGDIVMPFYYTNETISYNKSNIFQTFTWLDTSKEMTSLTLPTSSGSNRLHIFAITLWPVPLSNSTGPQLEVQYARSTKKWVEGTANTQVVEVTVSNIGNHGWVLANDSVSVSVESSGLTTVKPGLINRLRPGDQVVVEVGVLNKDGVETGTTGPATVHLISNTVHVMHSFQATFGIGPYEPTYESIYSHESPDWYNGAKFGIFIHWGPFSIPAWGNSGSNETYAEWYWWDLNSGPDTSDRTYEFHLENYGPDVVYDDFIANFSAEAYSAREWVDLFADAGATYFVQVTKHHDGYSLYDLPENVTKRTSVALHPHRDFVEELFSAAAEYQPQIHRATYYSLPEWFHPDYKSYGFGRWPGGNATNPFTNATLPYTGYVPVNDYLEDLVLPEMLTLANTYNTELMWCDIGGPNLTARFAAEWYNHALASGRQVSMNNRCGLPGDFDTPEYATLSATQLRKWESNAGMDPYSYGYNRATPDNEYMNASTIITSLVDIVSKNGNYLLDIGPTGAGNILPIEAAHLRSAGSWIKSHSEAIFNTTYYFPTPQEGPDIRFTRTASAFYILVMNQINSTLTLHSPIPWLAGDRVTVVGGEMDGTVVPSRSVVVGGSGRNDSAVVIDISDEVRRADRWTWVFKITY